MIYSVALVLAHLVTERCSIITELLCFRNVVLPLTTYGTEQHAAIYKYVYTVRERVRGKDRERER